MRKNANTKEPNRAVFELADQRPSGLFFDEDADGGTAAITTCSRTIKNRSVIEVFDDESGLWVAKKTRYITGCDSIFVDEQEKMNVKPTIDDTITLKSGKLMVTEEGITIGLYRYLTEGYSGNVDLKVSEGKIRRPSGAQDIIREVNNSGEVKDAEEISDSVFEALRSVHALKTKKGKEIVYNERLIAFYASLFRLPKYESGYKSEAWLALEKIARDTPEQFLERAASERSLYEADVHQSYAVGIIGIEKGKVYFVDTGKEICSVPAAYNESEKLAEVVDFFCSPENKIQYDFLRAKLQKGKGGATNIVK